MSICKGKLNYLIKQYENFHSNIIKTGTLVRVNTAPYLNIHVRVSDRIPGTNRRYLSDVGGNPLFNHNLEAKTYIWNIYPPDFTTEEMTEVHKKIYHRIYIHNHFVCLGT